MHTKITLISGLLATNALAYNAVSQSRSQILAVAIAVLAAVPQAVNGAPLLETVDLLTKRHGADEYEVDPSAGAGGSIEAEGKKYR